MPKVYEDLVLGLIHKVVKSTGGRPEMFNSLPSKSTNDKIGIDDVDLPLQQIPVIFSIFSNFHQIGAGFARDLFHIHDGSRKKRFGARLFALGKCGSYVI